MLVNMSPLPPFCFDLANLKKYSTSYRYLSFSVSIEGVLDGFSLGRIV